MSRTAVRLTILFAAPVLLLLVLTKGTRGQGRERVEQVNGREAVAGEILVKFRAAPSAAVLDEVQRLTDAESTHSIGRTGVRRVRSRSFDTAALLARFANRADVLYAEPNYIVHALAQPNDPSFPQLWGLSNVGQAVNGGVPGVAGSDIHALQAWEVSVGSTAQVVAIVDTGIDYTHPDLAANMWSAPSAFVVTINGTPITCPAGSHGFNAIALSCDPMDDHDHGSHVAGTIGASGNNGVGVAGVNWIAQLMAIKFLDASGSGSEADAINGIDFAIQAKQAFSPTGGANVRILSNSWGDTQFSQALLDEIHAANDADMLFVAAAGNNGISNDVLPTYPASYDSPNIVAVAATDNADARAWFSNYSATSVHLGAPGVDIFSTIIGGGYEFLSGTSMAAPHVSGAAALVLSRCALDTAALKNTLLATAEPVPSLTGITVTGGRLDVNSAIRSCVEPPEVPTALTATAGDSTVSLRWSGAAGALSYTVKRSLTPGGPYAPVASGVASKAYVDSTVVNGTTYYYVVSATNTLGDSADSNGASATPKTRSDLVIASLTVSSTTGAGSTVSVFLVTKNQGPGTSNPTTTRFYLSRSASIDANAIALDGAQAIPSLAPGATAAAPVTVDIPAVGVGIYYFFAKADADNVENETLESNNVASRLVTIGPDLVVSLSGPSTVAAGGTIAISDTVKNQGGAAADATTTRFYLSANALLDAGDITLSGARAVPALAVGAVSTGTTTLTIPASVTTGTYYLFAKADADNVVVETQELNNTGVKILQVGGDLIVSSLTVPAKAGSGSAVLVSDTTANQGAGAVPASTTRFYLSSNAVLDASDVLLVEGRSVPALASGAASSGSSVVTLPSTLTVGTYYLIAKADGDNAVAETQEANNTAARPIAIGPDLTVANFSLPFTITAGSTVTVTDTVLNQGGDPAGASTTRFYLSKDVFFDGSDLLLPGGRSVAALGAGASSTGSTPITIPAGTTPGFYYVFAVADGDHQVTESQEGNNTSVRVIQVIASP